MRGIIVATGPRLEPAGATPAALLPVGGKPLIAGPLAALLAAGIRHILIAAAPAEAPRLRHFLGDGKLWRAQFSYLLLPPAPCELAAAVALGGEFVGRRALALARGDCVIFGNGLDAQLQDAAQLKKGARVLVCRADGDAGAAVAEPRPGLAPGQEYAGLFFYDHTAAARMTALMREAPAAGIDDLHRAYLNDGRLRVAELAPAAQCVQVTGRDSWRAAGRAVAARENSP